MIRYQLGSPTFEESGFYKCFFCVFWAFIFHLGSTNPVFQEPTKALEQQTLHVNIKLFFRTDLFKSVDYLYWRVKYNLSTKSSIQLVDWLICLGGDRHGSRPWILSPLCWVPSVPLSHQYHCTVGFWDDMIFFEAWKFPKFTSFFLHPSLLEDIPTIGIDGQVMDTSTIEVCRSWRRSKAVLQTGATWVRVRRSGGSSWNFRWVQSC